MSSLSTLCHYSVQYICAVHCYKAAGCCSILSSHTLWVCSWHTVQHELLHLNAARASVAMGCCELDSSV